MLYNDYKYLLTFIQVFAVFFGLLGNIISFIIFSRKTFRNNSISTYCRALAIFDSLIFAELGQNIGEIASNFSFSLVIQHDAICKVFFYMMTLYSSIPAWILVAFSIDKMLSMRRNAILILRKKWFQWSVVAFISIFNIILYIEIPIKLVVKKHPLYNNTNYCDVSSLDFFTPFIYGYLFETDIIPFAVMFVTSIVTIRLLAKSRNALTRGQKADAQRKIRDKKFAISSLAFNIMFITFKMPLVIAYAQANNNLGVDLYFYSLALFLFFFNASINFYVHFATNSIFRRDLFVILRITKDPNATSINSKSGGVLNRIKPMPNITTNSRNIPNVSQNTRIEI